MKPLPEDMAEKIGHHLAEAEKAHAWATALLRAPAGHSPERMEDALNTLLDEAFLARRAFRLEAAR